MVALNASSARADWTYNIILLSNNLPPWMDQYIENAGVVSLVGGASVNSEEDALEMIAQFSTSAAPGSTTYGQAITKYQIEFLWTGEGAPTAGSATLDKKKVWSVTPNSQGSVGPHALGAFDGN